jgi:hypothetical protein
MAVVVALVVVLVEAMSASAPQLFKHQKEQLHEELEA